MKSYRPSEVRDPDFEVGGFLLFFALVGAPWFIVLGIVFFYIALVH